MNTFDAKCKGCETDIRVLSGTPLLCKACLKAAREARRARITKDSVKGADGRAGRLFYA